MGKLKTVYKNLSLKKALTITIVGSLFIAFLGAMAILLATRPSYYALAAENPENPILHWHNFICISITGIYVSVVIIESMGYTECLWVHEKAVVHSSDGLHAVSNSQTSNPAYTYTKRLTT